jgi:hypothetical protein
MTFYENGTVNTVKKALAGKFKESLQESLATTGRN